MSSSVELDSSRSSSRSSSGSSIDSFSTNCSGMLIEGSLLFSSTGTTALFFRRSSKKTPAKIANNHPKPAAAIPRGFSSRRSNQLLSCSSMAFRSCSFSAMSRSSCIPANCSSLSKISRFMSSNCLTIIFSLSFNSVLSRFNLSIDSSDKASLMPCSALSCSSFAIFSESLLAASTSA